MGAKAHRHPGILSPEAILGKSDGRCLAAVLARFELVDSNQRSSQTVQQVARPGMFLLRAACSDDAQ